MLKKAIVTTVDFCTRYSGQVVGIAVLLAVLCGIYAAMHFAIDADVNKLISKDLPWRQREAQFDKAFPPKEETTLAVIDAPTSELASQATAALIAKLSDQKDLFHSIMEAGGGPVLPEERAVVPADRRTWSTTTKKLGGGEAGHPVAGAGPQSARPDHGAQLRVDRRADEPLHARRSRRTLNMVADTIDEAIAGRPASFSWRAMLNGRPPTPSERRRFIEIRPVLDLQRADAGPEVDRRHPQGGGGFQHRRTIRRATAAHRTGADRRRGIRNRAGGGVHQHHRHDPGGADHPVAGVAIGATDSGGLHQPAGRALDHCRGRFGAGRRAQSDLGRVRGPVHRSRRRFRHPVQRALSRRAPRGRRSARGAAQHRELRGRAADARRRRDRGRLPVVPADRLQGPLRARPARRPRHDRRVPDQRHRDPGIADAVASPPGEPAEMGYKALAPVDRFMERQRIPVIVGTGLVVAAGLPLLYWLQFDFNPINLRSPKVESVATFLDLRSDPAHRRELDLRARAEPGGCQGRHREALQAARGLAA